MEARQLTGLISISALVMCLVSGAEAISDERYNQWQLKRLQEPSHAQLKAEHRGRVFIYDGLQDRDVNRVLDEQFGRIHSMMFIGTVVTDKQGKPKQDPSTGAIVTEDDGC